MEQRENESNAKMPTTTKKKSATAKDAPKPRQPHRAKNWVLRRTGSVQLLQTPALERHRWLVHGFSTRPGGASELPGSGDGSRKSAKALNLGFTDWDSRERVTANRKKFANALGAGKMSVVTLRQVHSDIVHRVDSLATAQEKAAQADALITRERGVLLAVQTADCVPILLADTKNRAVAAIHSGWRGTLRRIAEKTLGRMQMDYGTQPADVIAAIGPAIGGCCYEVGSEVAREFASQFPEAREWFDGPFDSLAAGDNDPNWLPWLTMRPPGHPPPPPRVQLDLIAANRAILAKAGVPAAQIFSSGFCTSCRTDLFFSYRREGTTGRLMAAIGIR
jgi:polyphenol oxidase